MALVVVEIGIVVEKWKASRHYRDGAEVLVDPKRVEAAEDQRGCRWRGVRGCESSDPSRVSMGVGGISVRESRMSCIDSRTVVVVRSRRAGMSVSEGVGDGKGRVDCDTCAAMSSRRWVMAAESKAEVDRAAAVVLWIDVASAWVASVC